MSDSTSLKVGFVLDDTLDSVDGVQQYILTLGTWLKEHGHEVHYLVGQTRRKDITNVHSLSKNLRVRFNGNRMSIPLPASRRKLRKLLAQEQFDVLHVQMPYSPWLAQRIILAAPSRTAIVGTFHIVPYSFMVKLANRCLALWTRRSLRRFEAVMSVSSAAAAFAGKAFKLSSEVLPNVFDYQRFARARRLPQYTKEKLTVVFLGRLVPRKGALLLLETLTQLLKHGHGLPGFRVVICGRGPQEAQLRAYATEHHLEATVEFAGFVSEEDKPRYLSSADIAVFPSTGGESFGIVLIEAMASGHAAVLGGNNAGYATVLEDRPDLLFDPNHVASFSQALRRFLGDEKQRRDAARWAREYSKRFDVDVIGPKLVDIYNETLRKKR